MQRGGVTPEADGVDDDGDAANDDSTTSFASLFGGATPLVDAARYLGDAPLPLELTSAPLFAATRADTAAVPVVRVISAAEKRAEKRSAARGEKRAKTAARDADDESRRAAEDMAAADVAAHVDELVAASAADPMDRDWLAVQCARYLAAAPSTPLSTKEYVIIIVFVVVVVV